MPQRVLGRKQAYLVQSTTGSLSVMSRQGQQEPGARTSRFDVVAIYLETQPWTEVKNLKNTSLFLGWNSSFSLEINEKHHIKSKRIYFTDDYLESSRHTKNGGGKDMGIYHLEDGKIEPHFSGKSYSHFSPPLWIEPNF
ncbi:hypothetical protein ACJRO7_030015 [Eucalyptus globulus]|uniref:KIB1-4 beta-propeller domain-containing protein n=1 Tax=Eucalyptus globulus TaxID=34317 RepID=A0ABD3JDS2_EUCGL